jgi:transcriptional regulator with XRE-family HTH domain
MGRYYGRLRGKIKQVFGSMESFAEACGKSSSIVSKKLNGKIKITSDDIEEWSKLLGIQIDQVHEYFFAE